MDKRGILLVVHPTRPGAAKSAEELIANGDAHFKFFIFSDLELQGAKKLNSEADLALAIKEIEIAVVLGGDGTILRAAELLYPHSIPILGINLGHVGFLAQINRPSIAELLAKIKDREFSSEKRLLVQYQVERSGQVISSGFALNEVVIESSKPEMVELFVQVDERPLSRWGCDGVLISTPTGSTAYAFSAGGPVIWPEVKALVLLPLAAHALFSRPMVIGPESKVAIDVESESATLSADGLRRLQLLEHDRITLSVDENTIYLAHIDGSLFADRIVAKFQLPVEGWRGR
jgi:NAD+ kinase